MKRSLAMVLLALHTATGWALDVRFVRVAENVYAHIGDIGGRSVANQGLNANLGLLVTASGALLIDSGATRQSAELIDAAVRRVTTQPVRWVINTGGQDHRWFGNAYFAERGAAVIAHATARADMVARGGDQLAALQRLLGPSARGTEPQLPTRWIDGPDSRLELGGVAVELRHRGGGHTPGDMMVWLPQQGVVFTGDIVYVERLLAVLPISSTKHWLEAFEVLEAINPRVIVPGHGAPTSLATAQAHTRDYLKALRLHMKKAVDAQVEIGEAVRSFDAGRFLPLANAAELMPGNANRVYLEIERE